MATVFPVRAFSVRKWTGGIEVVVDRVTGDGLVEVVMALAVWRDGVEDDGD